MPAAQRDTYRMHMLPPASARTTTVDDTWLRSA
jgi:hypothetical protein